MTQPDALHHALGRVLTDYHWRAFCDSWLAIGLAATLIRWGSDGIVGWPDEESCRKDVAKIVGRTRRKK